MLDYARELRGAFDRERGCLTVPADWEGYPGAAFGGFVAAAVLTAAADRTAQPRPLSLFARYYRPVPLEWAVALTLAPERTGRSVETLTAKLMDADRLLASFSLAFGRDGEAPLDSQAAAPMGPLVRPRPVWQLLEESGLEVPRLMRRVGFRGEPDGIPARETSGDWHLRAEWPAPTGRDAAVQAAVAVMAIDCFVAPATMRANQVPSGGDWPVMMPSLDLTSWFYAPEATCDAGEWLCTRTSVPASAAGYAVGRTQVWARDRLVAEGMSQVALVPVASG